MLDSKKMKVRAAVLPTGAQTPAEQASSVQAASIVPCFSDTPVATVDIACVIRKFAVDAGKRHFCPGPALTVEIA